jgi:hypothetical protein
VFFQIIAGTNKQESTSSTHYHHQPLTGKTTFLNDTTKSHKCTYIRQYHSIRPYVTVSKIPNFDPSKLPFWDIYEKEGKAESIQVGGTMAGEFTGTYNSLSKFSKLPLLCFL